MFQTITYSRDQFGGTRRKIVDRYGVRAVHNHQPTLQPAGRFYGSWPVVGVSPQGKPIMSASEKLLLPAKLLALLPRSF